MTNSNATLGQRVSTELGGELQKHTPNVFRVLSPDLITALRGKIIVLVGNKDVAIVDTIDEAEALKGSTPKKLIQVPLETSMSLDELEGR